jgi:GT2 family glycosyltransferase
MKKISIILTYFNRLHQLSRTIKSIVESSYTNYEIIIIDDASYINFNLDDCPVIANNKNKIKIIRILPEEKFWNNPVIILNKGIKIALDSNPDIIIYQNGESSHYGDILKYVSDNLTDENYISFGCFSVDRNLTLSGLDFKKILPDLIKTNKNIHNDMYNVWYNHPEYRPVGYDFCCAITPSNIKKLNGFDERYAKILICGDDDLVLRIKRMGLKIIITSPPDPIVIHQWHEKRDLENVQDVIENGFKMFEYIKNNEQNNYKATHIITSDFI